MSELRPKDAGEKVVSMKDKPKRTSRKPSTPPRKNKTPSKICVKCHKVKGQPSFYKNREWAEQMFADAWCRSCVNSHAKDKDTLREYCWYNNRRWGDDLWDRAAKSAEYTMSSDHEYLKANQEKKEKLMDEAICQKFFQVMNLVTIYEFSPNIQEDGVYRVYNPDSIAGTKKRSIGDALEDDEDVMYSAKWNGEYTKRELEFLDTYFEQLSGDYAQDTKNERDYARKVCVASQNADNASNRYRRGQIPINEQRDAVNIFDSLSKSSMFAACKRTGSERGGDTSWSQASAKLQASGKIEAVSVKWPKDAVDVMLDEYYKIAEKLQREGVFS